MRNSNTYNLTKIGLMAGFVMVATFFKIEIPLGFTKTMLHLGNAACLLSGLLLGPINGAIASVVGTVVFDLLNPIYFFSVPFTFVFKFIMVFVCGKIAYLKGKNGENTFYNIIGTVLGSTLYIILRIAKSLIINLFFLNIPLAVTLFIVAKSTFISLINAIVAVIVSVVLTIFLKRKF